MQSVLMRDWKEDTQRHRTELYEDGRGGLSDASTPIGPSYMKTDAEARAMRPHTQDQAI